MYWGLQMKKSKTNTHSTDISYKKAFSIFRNKILDFLGLDLPKIKTVLTPEAAEIKVTKNIMDMVFMLEDGSILHIEPEIDLSQKDTLRFLRYDIELYAEHGAKINTIVISDKKVKTENTKIEGGCFDYCLKYIDMSQLNADEKIEEVKEKIQRGEKINELELIFLPMMKSEKEKGLLVEELIEIEKKLDIEWEKKEQMVITTLVLSNKLISEEYYHKILEEIRMIGVIEYGLQKAREEGMEKGIEKGMARGIEKGIERGIERGIEKGMERGIEKGMEKGKADIIMQLLLKKFKHSAQQYKEKIQNLDSATLNVLAMDILEMEDIKEVEKYF